MSSKVPWRRGLFLLIVLAAAGILWYVARVGLTASAAAVGVVGLLLAFGALALTVAQQFPAATAPKGPPVTAATELGDDIRRQWLDEAAARSIGTDTILPVTWTVESSAVADTDQPEHPWQQVGIGMLNGDFLTAAEEIAREYRRVDNGRLVILGQPGAGKTVIAMLLTVGLLPNREPSRADPVPVLLSASSWDPVCETLDDWVVRCLALSNFNGRPDVPRLLLRERLLLPIVDGLDEIPESSRRAAVHRINHAIRGGRPIVVTCRATEYQDAICGGAPVLRRAPVITVQPVPAPDAVAYLTAIIEEPGRPEWDRVFQTMAGEPGGPVAEALSSPLLISLAATVYADAGSHPAELLDPEIGQARHSVEDHLLDRAVAVRFDGDERATRRLTFLATYLHRNRERELAWWLMADRLLPRLTVPVVGLILGLAVMVIGTLLAPVAFSLLKTEGRQVEHALIGGGTVGVLSTAIFILTWYAVPARPPGTLSWSVTGAWPRVRHALLTGFALPVVPGAAVLAATLAVLPLIRNWTYPALHTATAGAVTVAAAGCVLAAGLAVEAWLTAPPERSSRPSPDGFLAADRRSALAGALAAGVTVMLVLPLIYLLAMPAGDALAHLVAGHAGAGPMTDGIRPLDTAVGWENNRANVVGVLGLHCLAIVLMLLVTRAWPRYLVVRAYLAVLGRLPWRLPEFLTRARTLQLLRVSGSTYQFRHIRLQDRLAGSAAIEGTANRSPGEQVPSRRRTLLPVGLIAVLLIVAATMIDTSSATSRRLLLAPPQFASGPYLTRPATALSADGRRLVVLRDGVIDTWQLDLTGQRTSRYEGFRAGQDTFAVAVSPDGAEIAMAGRDSVLLLDLSGKASKRWANQRSVASLAYTRDGRLVGRLPTGAVIAAGREDDSWVTLRTPEDCPRGHHPVIAPRPKESDYVAVTQKGSKNESLDDICLLEAYYRRETRPSDHTSAITAMTFANRDKLFTGSATGTVRVRSIEDGGAGTPVFTSSRLKAVRAIAVPAKPGGTVVIADGADAEVWSGVG
ncbi:NACHT domain-containing protein [Actinoplanes sp. G11-F43]|uniref:NACHT domain-containing protein n=1 Tax=Actinoplanes sp. G11-F43 TaxID=3424130 RepID=UPI003D356EED